MRSSSLVQMPPFVAIGVHLTFDISGQSEVAIALVASLVGTLACMTSDRIPYMSLSSF
jgi:hypothetical protein